MKIFYFFSHILFSLIQLFIQMHRWCLELGWVKPYCTNPNIRDPKMRWDHLDNSFPMTGSHVDLSGRHSHVTTTEESNFFCFLTYMMDRSEFRCGCFYTRMGLQLWFPATPSITLSAHRSINQSMHKSLLEPCSHLLFPTAFLLIFLVL